MAIIPDNNAVPMNVVNLVYAAGPAASGQSEYDIVLIGNKLSAGDAVAADGYGGTIYGPSSDVPLASEADAIARFGSGSDLHRQYLFAIAANRVSPIKAIVVTESVGSKASKDIVVSGTATANGTIRVKVGAESVDVGCATGDLAATIATAIAAAVNAKTSLPVVASVVSATVSLTAKQKGTKGNALTCSAVVRNSCGVSCTPATRALFTGGTVDDDITAALASLDGAGSYYLVPSCSDATQLGKVSTFVVAQSDPLNGHQCRAVAGFSGSVSAAVALGPTINQQLCEIVHALDSDHTPGEIAASLAAQYAAKEASFTAESLNFCGDATGLKASSANTRVTANQLVTLLNSGITPIKTEKNGSTSIVRRITTRCLTGATPDFRIRDAHKVSVMQHFGNDWVSKCNLEFAGKMIADDPIGNEPTPPNAVTPKQMKAASDSLVKEYAGNGLIEHPEVTVRNTVWTRDGDSRFSGNVALDIADLFAQSETRVSQEG